ncbi:MAG TPA: glycosyltransferase family 39 protein [Verrucomicrobiae bacterium]|nr:glycosyltransferase family 39 protein [Verrucomicrobiae bacterium]
MPRFLASPRNFYILIGGYFLLQILLRLIASGTTDLDESEQLLATQQLALGYGPQPPLYTWLQFPLIRIFGANVFALALLKDILLFGIYAMTYRNARLVTRDHWRSVIASISLLFIPEIAWESQRDLTHSVLVTLLATATFFAFLKLRENRQLRWYFAFGIFLALGVLSKYSFAIFAIALLVAALTIPTSRRIVWNWRMLLALAICFVLLAPHLIWAAHHTDWVMSTSKKLGMSANSWPRAILAGLANMFTGFGTHVGLLVVLFVIACWKSRGKKNSDASMPDGAKTIARGLLVMLVLLVAGIFIFKVTGFKDRWFLPLCVWVPILLVTIFESRLTAGRMRALASIAGMIALVISILIPARVWFSEQIGFTQAINAPFDLLAREIRRNDDAFAGVIAINNWVGGNLKKEFPKKIVFTPRIFLKPDLRAGDECLLVWDAPRDAEPPKKFLAFAAQFSDVDMTGEKIIEARLKHFQTKTMRLGIARCKVKPGAETILKNLPAELPGKKME